MHKVTSRIHRLRLAWSQPPHGAPFLLALSAFLILGQLCFRAWAVYPSWFFADDYVLLRDARQHDRPDVSYLFSAFDIHFMPIGRALAWVIAHAGTANWAAAATMTLALQLAASASFVYMLWTLFGNHWGNLALLALYLTGSMSIPALMWWSVTITQLPLQTAYFVAIGSWVHHLRRGGTVPLAVTAGAVVLALLTDVRGILVIPILAWLLVAYWSQGSLGERLRAAVRTFRAGVIVIAVLAVGYVTFYVLAVPPPFEDGDGGPLSKLPSIAEAMLGAALPVAAWGGPWRWLETGAPLVLAGPPSWAVHLAWVLSAAVVAYALLRRTRTGRAWVLLAAYAGMLYTLLAASRGQVYGAFVGLEYRYLTEMAFIVPICLGLAFMTLPGALEGSAPREIPLLLVRVRQRYLLSLLAAVTIGSVASSTLYVRYWHDRNANRNFTKIAQAELAAAKDVVDLSQQTLPQAVMPPYAAPVDRTTEYLPLVASNFRFPETSDRLQVLDTTGRLREALIDQASRSRPGPVPDCGWRLTQRTTTIPVTTPVASGTWWLRFGYVASQGSPAEVETGGDAVRARIRSGVHSLFVRVDGPMDTVTVSGLQPDTTVCVDIVEVGQPVAVEDVP